MILIPSVIALAVTLLRLAGELRHWSEKWFSPATGGIEPSGLSWVIGITWLAIPFGIYFALKLAAAGLAPPRIGKSVGYSILSLVVGGFGLMLVVPRSLACFI